MNGACIFKLYQIGWQWMINSKSTGDKWKSKENTSNYVNAVNLDCFLFQGLTWTYNWLMMFKCLALMKFALNPSPPVINDNMLTCNGCLNWPQKVTYCVKFSFLSAIPKHLILISNLSRHEYPMHCTSHSNYWMCMEGSSNGMRLARACDGILPSLSKNYVGIRCIEDITSSCTMIFQFSGTVCLVNKKWKAQKRTERYWCSSAKELMRLK